jgi:hypothetical protein
MRVTWTPVMITCRVLPILTIANVLGVIRISALGRQLKTAMTAMVREKAQMLFMTSVQDAMMLLGRARQGMTAPVVTHIRMQIYTGQRAEKIQ